MENLGLGLAEVVASAGHAAAAVGRAPSPSTEGSSSARAMFQWGGTIFALFLLILNRTGRRSSMKTSLLVLYLFTSFPTVLFKVLRGPFGCWVAFLAVAANLFWPESFPASRFLLFVITPDWLADELRDSIFSCVVCLIVGVSLLITELGGIRRFGSCQWNFHCIASCLGIAFLFFFTIRYLCLGTW